MVPLSQPPSERRSVSEHIVNMVANRANIDPLELPPLYESIDPDALDAIIREISDGGVCFQYAGYVVRVESNKTIYVADCHTATDSPENITTELANDSRKSPRERRNTRQDGQRGGV